MIYDIQFYILEGCVPYSQQACEDAANNLGLQKGGGNFNFAGDFETKGCYSYESGSYANMAFYGTGGSVEQSNSQLNVPKFRPLGHDCSNTGKIQ